MAQAGALLGEIREGWKGQKPATPMALHVGPLASGAAVLADELTAKRILEQHRELLGIEMEVYAVFAAAEESAAPRPVPLGVKAVVDFADGDKGDEFQAYGSYASTAVLQYFAEKLLE